MKEKDILSKDLARELKAYGVSRRDFLKYCATTAAVLGLSEFEFTTKLAQALEKPAPVNRLSCGVRDLHAAGVPFLLPKVSTLLFLRLFWIRYH